MSKSYETGRQGEDLACKYLLKQGYEILERNFAFKNGEIDIISKYKNEIVFIEVKTRTNSEYGLPADSVTMQKIKHIYKTAEYYIYIKKLSKINARIDVIEICFSDNKYYINHLKNVI